MHNRSSSPPSFLGQARAPAITREESSTQEGARRARTELVNVSTNNTCAIEAPDDARALAHLSRVNGSVGSGRYIYIYLYFYTLSRGCVFNSACVCVAQVSAYLRARAFALNEVYIASMRAASTRRARVVDHVLAAHKRFVLIIVSTTIVIIIIRRALV